MKKGVSVIVLLGAPGAGKGTVARYLKEKYGVCHFSTGNLLRNEIQRESDLGLKVKGIVGSGGLVEDCIVDEIVEENLREAFGNDDVVVLDGYPRTKNQAAALDKMISGSLKDSLRVIEISVGTDVLVSRLSQRRVCVKCGNAYGPQDKADVCSCGGQLIKRKDDEKSTIMNRFRKYEEDTRSVSDYYVDKSVKISGEGTPEEVAQRIETVLHDFGIEKRR